MTSEGSSNKRRNLIAIATAVIGVIALSVGAAVLISADDRAVSQKKQGKVAEESGEKAEDGMRTLVVFKTSKNPAPSAPNGLMRARRVKGEIPKTVTVATVKTDEDCAPNSAGISNCLNKLRLKDGSMLEVRHPHDMHKVPCLSPGEKVNVKPA